ncbi:MAG: glycosyltransferase family 4 protein [Acidimicrobiales bacterium]
MTAGTIAVALDVLPLVGQPSGVGAACRGLVDALAGRPEIDLTGYAVARKAFLARRELPRTVGFRGTPVPTRLAEASWRLGRVKAELVTGKADVVHGTNFVVPPSRRAGTVVTVHDLTSVRFPALCTAATLRYPALVRKAVDRGALVHVPSAFVRDEVVDLLEVPTEQVHVIGWGVPPVSLPSTAPPVAPPYILALGTVEPRKDYPSLVEAFGELRDRDPGLRLVVAGADGWATTALTDAIDRHRLESRVVRVGYVNEEERNALLWNASVLAYPSLYEGFGFPPLEAMIAGIPVVATRSGGVPGVVGDAAILVEPHEPGLLAAALWSVLADSGVAERLVAAGRNRVACFDWASTADQMMELYWSAARSTWH